MRLFAALTLAFALPCCGGSVDGPAAPGPVPTPASPSPVPTPSPVAPSPSPEPSPTSSEPVVIRSATLRGVSGHSASGTARILRQPGGGYVLELGNDFRIDSGNNDVILTRGTGDPAPSDLNLGAMHSTRGFQTYPLPGDGGAYSYVMLWCRPFRVPIGLGELR